MPKIPKIVFDEIEEFKQFCKKNKISPRVFIEPKKHSNMRGEFFHILSGEMSLNRIKMLFCIEEELVKKDKLAKKEEGYEFSDIFL